MALQCEATGKGITALSSVSIKHLPGSLFLFQAAHLCCATIQMALSANHPEYGVCLPVRSLAFQVEGRFPEKMPA